MPDLINPLPSLVVNPLTGDTDRAEDILDEIQDVMKKHGCVLMISTDIGRPQEMLLAKVTDPAMMQARVIAGIKDISPFRRTWRKIEARKERSNVFLPFAHEIKSLQSVAPEESAPESQKTRIRPEFDVKERRY